PSEKVWSGVELSLEKASGTSMRRRLVYYQWMAAASVIFSLGIASLYFLDRKESAPLSVTATQARTDENKSAAENNTTINLSADVVQQATHANRLPSGIDTRNDSPSGTSGKDQFRPLSTHSVLAEIRHDQVQETRHENRLEGRSGDALKRVSGEPLHNRPLPALQFNHNKSTADPGMVLLAQLRDEEKKYIDADRNSKHTDERLWTSFGFGAGTFNPNAPSTVTYSQPVFLNNSGSTSGYTSTNPATAGASYSFGLQVGGNISNRIVLLSGISYLNQNASYTSNLATTYASAKRAMLNDQAFIDLNTIPTSPYSVSSTLQYVSIPMQAGYMIVNRRFGWQLNGGVATDFFMQNTLTPDNDQIDAYSQGPGSESPYRPVTFSGLAGTEISYRLADRYRIAINPGVRYALQSIPCVNTV
nr:PorT family protein [Cyclobacteriaceae bacterium]